MAECPICHTGHGLRRALTFTAYHGRAEPCTRIKHLFTCRSQYHMHLF
jgi:hypothetical protein